MKYIKYLLSAIGIISALLGLTNILDYWITSPIMFLSLGGVNSVLAHENYKESKKGQAILLALVAVFSIYVAVFSFYIYWKIYFNQ